MHRARLFHQQSDQHLASAPDPYTVFLRCVVIGGRISRHVAFARSHAFGLPCACRLLVREDWSTQEISAKLLTAVIDSRPKKSSAFANGILSADATPSTAATYGTPDPAEPVSPWHGNLHMGLLC